MDDLLKSLDYQLGRLAAFPDVKTQLEERDVKLSEAEDLLNQRLVVVEQARGWYQKAVDLLYERSVGEIERLVNEALHYIYFDKRYTFSIDLSERYGKSMSFVLVDEDSEEPAPVDIRHGVGKGIRTCISFVIHVYYILNRRTLPILFLDESYTFVSSGYFDRFMEFVKTLCREKGLGVVLIANDPRFPEHADRIYHVGNGEVRLLETMDDLDSE